MRLADFIRTEIEPILQDWEEFAKTIFYAKHMGKIGLRDHAREMLLDVAGNFIYANVATANRMCFTSNSQ
ncbi:hypothetical protein [Nitrincola sp. MINF-07-Sa-05]|uniref:hypothetical protein n=1 Tax=Nitrincola salilacus TaxID=3400273 RepID=UPI003918063F